MKRAVVTGMGVISPVGNDVKTFWDNIVNARHGIGPITKFDATDYKAKLAAEVKDFNARAYMEKTDVMRSDLYAQYALAAAGMAVNESGVVGTVDPERFGVYFGSGIGGIGTFQREMDKLRNEGPKKVSPFFIPMLISNMAAGAVAIRFNCKGPAMPSVTACASGANAIGEALRSIRHGYADAIITGGAEAAVTELGMAGFINMQALSVAQDPSAASLPFDRRRAGFVIGEGAGALVLEEYEHAKARGAKIFGEVAGYGSSCDAYHITAPIPGGAGGARAMREAMREAGYSENESIYINAHGTGTPLNDAAETLAIKNAFGEKKAKKIRISSTKAVTGHMLGAAGAAEAIVCLLALGEGIIPPTANLSEPDGDCDLDYVPIKAVIEKADAALSNSFGFGGHNACLAFRRI